MILKIKEPYFSNSLRWAVAIIGLGLSIYLLTSTTYGLASILIGLIVLIVFSTGDSISIDTRNNTINDEFLFLWIPTESEEITYKKLDKITIGKDRHRYTANSRGKTGVTDFNEYIALLHYDNNSDAIELKRSINYKSFEAFIDKVAEDLKIEVERTS